MAQLINDDLGLPIPQYLSNSTGLFESMRGSDGAIFVKNVNDPADGINKAKIYAADGTVLNVTSQGVPVVCNQHAINMYEYDSVSGTWVPKTKQLITPNLLASAVRFTSTVSPAVAVPLGARNVFILIDVTAVSSSSITGIDIKIPITGTNVLYKTLTLGAAISAVGKTIVTFGLDDATNKFAIPPSFVISLGHLNTNNITYSVDVHIS